MGGLIRETLKKSNENLKYSIFIFGIAMLCVLKHVEDIGNTHFQPPPEAHIIKSSQFDPPNITAGRKVWHDYKAMLADLKRIGPGEQGQATKLTANDSRLNEVKANFQKLKYNGIVSKMISVNRSVPGIAEIGCHTKQYLSKLPTASIVILCGNEYDSALQRTLHSIVNRTPKELLKEIIMVHDNNFTVNKVLNFSKNFPTTVIKLITSPLEASILEAKNTGASIAKGDVLVFFDAYIECNHNWLPPLLEPIAIDKHIATSPIIDTIDNNTFAYEMGRIWRTGFRWDFSFVRLDFTKNRKFDATKPFQEVIMDSIFAISRKFFLTLGGFDDSPNAWGAERFEFSFKIAMCGGMCLIVPCSHVGRVNINSLDNEQQPNNILARSRKRVAEVWMDKYKRNVYHTNHKLYKKLNAGSLGERHKLRKSLKCKPFQWFVDFVAADFKQQLNPPDFANGTLQSLAFKNTCLHLEPGPEIGLRYCAKARNFNQIWNLNYLQELSNSDSTLCLDRDPGDKLLQIRNCHGNGGEQFWFYDSEKKWLINAEFGFDCMEAVLEKHGFRIELKDCDEKNSRMKWIFSYVNDINKPSRQ